jgi:hypothetical protein
MEVKWIAIMVMILFGSMFAGMGYSEHSKSQCQIEGIRAGMPANDIIKLCGK